MRINKLIFLYLNIDGRNISGLLDFKGFDVYYC